MDTELTEITGGGKNKILAFAENHPYILVAIIVALILLVIYLILGSKIGKKEGAKGRRKGKSKGDGDDSETVDALIDSIHEKQGINT